MTSRHPIAFKDRVIYEEKVTMRGQHYYEPYTIGKMLGKGGFACCYEIRDSREGKRNAVKIISKYSKNPKTHAKEDNTEKIKEEIAFISTLDHPGVVKYVHHFHDRMHFFIILELCHYGSFNDILKKRKTLTEPEARFFIAQIVEILKYIKSKNIVHRDIKLANFLVDENFKIKLGDFGLATYYHNIYRTRGRMCGTPNYIAPEIIEKKEYGFEVDAWSTGVLIFTLLFGVPPFQTKSLKQTYMRIRTCQYQFEGFKNHHIVVSDDARNFIKSILNINVRERLKIQDFMAHPFMSRYKIPKQLESTFLTSVPSASFTKMHGRISKKQEAALIKKEKEIAEMRAERMLKISQTQTQTRARPLIVTYKDALGVKIQQRHEERWFQTPPKSEKCQEEEQVNDLKDVQDALEEDLSACGRKKFCPNVQLQLAFTVKKDQKQSKKEEVIVKVEKVLPIPQPELWKRPAIIFKLKYVDRTAQNQQLYEKQLKVIFWQNATQQYGLIYVLSNHQIGIYFNDASTMITSTNKKQIHYLQRKEGKVIEQVIPFDDQKTSKEEAKDRFHQKMQIFTHHHWNLRKIFPFIEDLSEGSQIPSLPLHIKSFKPVDRKMAIFKMSDNNIQYFFEDNSSVFMSFTANIISYKCNDKLAVATFPLTDKTVILPEFKAKVQEISSFYKKFLPKKSPQDASQPGHSLWNIKQERSKSAIIKTKQE